MNTELVKLEADENILKVVRKHWFILFSHTIGLVFMSLIPVFFVAFWSISDTASQLLLSAYIDGAVISFFMGAWFLIVLVAVLGVWTDYYLDMWIITNKRIISIDQQGFFRRSVSSFRFERLQDITVDIKGFIETMLDFGRMTADTAGSEPFIIRGIPNPRAVKGLILEYADQVHTHQVPPKDFL